MEIKRIVEGKEVKIELTGSEIKEAHETFVKSWMASEALNLNEKLSEKDAADVAEMAFEKYSEGKGLTEYEALEEAMEEFQKTRDDNNIGKILDNIQTLLFGSLFSERHDKTGLQYVTRTGEKNSFIVKDKNEEEYRISVTKETE